MALQCGCSGSTSGGLKSDRVYIVLKAVIRQVRTSLHPSSVTQIKAGRHYISDRDAVAVLLYMILYFAVIIVGIFLLVLCGVDILSAVSGAVSSMGNVGPGLGSIGSLGTFAYQPAAAKIIYSIGMILGRLEIYPVLVVFTMMFKRDK